MLNVKEKLELKKMITSNEDFEDMTETIRKLKHSKILRPDIASLVACLDDYKQKNLSNEEIKEALEFEKLNSFYFLYTYYTDIYNKIVANEIDLVLLNKLVDTLEKIENEEFDMNEGSYIVGKILKEMYVDSAIKRGEKLDKQYEKKYNQHNNINWKEFKKLQKK